LASIGDKKNEIIIFKKELIVAISFLNINPTINYDILYLNKTFKKGKFSPK
jgi:hypothetical protein